MTFVPTDFNGKPWPTSVKITKRGRALENVREIQAGNRRIVVIHHDNTERVYELVRELSPCIDALCEWGGGGSGGHLHTTFGSQPEAAS